ncbi:hypothetical protein B566_EDAN008995 [Ephemera danica]|nr:hypothetical protein B566_EDAN008995 [Ephemera danica]
MTSHRGTPDRERRKLIIYSLYAWGCPLIMLVVSIIMDYAPGIPNTALKPQFGVQRCWFGDKLAVFAYFFGPISVLLICNLVLFIMTAVRIVKLRRGTAVLKHADSQRSDQREKQQKFVLYLKLFLVMGLTWIMELVSWTVGGSNYLWIVTDVCNTLQGLCIFLIFVWKPKVRRLLIARLRGKKRPSPSGQSDGIRAAALSRLSKPDASYSESSTKQSSMTQTTSLIAESMPDVAKCTVSDTDNE